MKGETPGQSGPGLVSGTADPVAVDAVPCDPAADAAAPVVGGPARLPLWSAARLGRGIRDYVGALTALIVIVVVLATTQNGFLTVSNLQNVLQSNAPLFLVSIGMTFVVVSGGFDLSIGAMMAVAEELLFVFINKANLSAPLAVIVAVIVCGLIGALLNGVAIGMLRLNFFVVTLGSMILLQGIVLVASSGTTSTINSSWLQSLGNNTVGVVPIPVLICAAMLVLGWFVLRLTAFGRSVFCVGGNAEAARLSGISVPWTVVVVYGVSGMCGGLAGVVDAGRLASATPTAGSTIALSSAAAVLLGGASLAGGIGKLAGTTVGVLVLALLGNGVDLFGVSAYYQDVVTGAVLLIAILLDQVHKSGLLRLAGRQEKPLRAPLS